MTNLFSYPLHILTKKLRLISTLILSRLVLISFYSYILYCCYLGVLFLKTLKQLEYLNLQNLPGVEDPRYIICTYIVVTLVNIYALVFFKVRSPQRTTFFRLQVSDDLVCGSVADPSHFYVDPDPGIHIRE